MNSYTPKENYTEGMEFRRLGRSGLLMPALSLGFWQNFGASCNEESAREMVTTALDNGITCFDLANNYGPPSGAAEELFGRLMASTLRPLRDQIIVTTKAGYLGWEGPYGNWGSRKYLVSSCDRSLRNMGLDYVDIFYSHRYDPETPLEETMGALDYIVRSGRALYAALSNYPPEAFRRAVEILKDLGTPCVAHQIKYSLLVQERGDSLFDLHKELGVGCVTFSPLAQGQLTNRYLNGIPADSRVRVGVELEESTVMENLPKVKALAEVAESRGQSLAQMALAWQLNGSRVDSVIIGASRLSQLLDNLGALKNTDFSAEELALIDQIVGK